MSKSEAPISMNEHLSALLDDEAGSFEQRRVLDELKSDEALSQKLANYALIGEVMKSDSPQSSIILGSSFLDNIHEQIANDDPFENVILNKAPANQDSSQPASGSSSILRPIGGFALAASVGAFAFMGLQNIGLLKGPSNPSPSIVDSSGPTAIAAVVPEVKNSESVEVDAANANNQYVDADAQTRSMLKRYVDSHMQYATSSTFVPSVRVIAYTDNQ